MVCSKVAAVAGDGPTFCPAAIASLRCPQSSGAGRLTHARRGVKGHTQRERERERLTLLLGVKAVRIDTRISGTSGFGPCLYTSPNQGLVDVKATPPIKMQLSKAQGRNTHRGGSSVAWAHSHMGENHEMGGAIIIAHVRALPVQQGGALQLYM